MFSMSLMQNSRKPVSGGMLALTFLVFYVLRPAFVLEQASALDRFSPASDGAAATEASHSRPFSMRRVAGSPIRLLIVEKSDYHRRRLLRERCVLDATIGDDR